MKTSRPKRNGQPAARETSPAFTSATEFRQIGVALLLDPLRPARETFDDDKLFELIESIREVGVLEPLLVEEEGQNFRVWAGHRRLTAARAAGLTMVPCRVYSPGTFSGHALMHHENKFREDLNPAEEARHFLELLESQAAGDVDKLCSIVKERREYVEARLLLVQGDPTVFRALMDSAISIGVAQELNRINDPARRSMYLESAMQNGASVRMVRDWRIRGNAQDAVMSGQPAAGNPTDFQPVPAAEPDKMQCYICESAKDAHDLRILYVHDSCARAMQRIRDRDSAAGQPTGSE